MAAVVASHPIFFDLTSPNLKPSAALYLCEYLVRLIGSEVTTFRRNTLASYHFVNTARQVVSELQQLIEEVNSTGNVQSFWKWTKALTPLEKLLLNFDPKDFISSDKLVEVSAPLACKKDLDTWKETRTITHTKLESLRGTEGLKELSAVSNAPELQNVYRRDDLAFLNDLVTEIKARTIPTNPGPPETFKTMFGKVPEQVSKIAELFRKGTIYASDPEVLVVAQSTMAICGWSHFSTNSGEDVTTLKHMWSEEVCSSAETLLNGLIGLGSDLPEAKKELTQVQALYTAFIDLAFGIPDLSCIDLMKLLNDIGRAYHAQALALIALCNEAVNHHKPKPNEAKPNEVNPGDLDKVKKIGLALDETSKALSKAANIANASVGALGLPQWTAHKEGTAYEQDDCSKQFEATMTNIVKTFKDLGVNTKVVDYNAALVEDKALTAKANKRMETVEASSKKAVKVTVNVYQGDGSETVDSTHEVQVGRSTLVSAIEWGISSIPKMATELAGKTVHFKLANGNEVAKHQEIDKLEPTADTLILKMFVNSPTPQPNGTA